MGRVIEVDTNTSIRQLVTQSVLIRIVYPFADKNLRHRHLIYQINTHFAD
jgi:hypothetical protein